MHIFPQWFIYYLRYHLVSNKFNILVKYQYPLIHHQRLISCVFCYTISGKQTDKNKSRASAISVDLTDSCCREFGIIWSVSCNQVQKGSKIYLFSSRKCEQRAQKAVSKA